MDTERWKAVVAYRSDEAPRIYEFEEVHKLHQAIKDGPFFGDVDSITVTYQRRVQLSWKKAEAV